MGSSRAALRGLPRPPRHPWQRMNKHRETLPQWRPPQEGGETSLTGPQHIHRGRVGGVYIASAPAHPATGHWHARWEGTWAGDQEATMAGWGNEDSGQ